MKKKEQVENEEYLSGIDENGVSTNPVVAAMQRETHPHLTPPKGMSREDKKTKIPPLHEVPVPDNWSDTTNRVPLFKSESLSNTKEKKNSKNKKEQTQKSTKKSNGIGCWDGKING